MKISVIVPYRPGEKRLARCLDSVRASVSAASAEWEVVAVEGREGVAAARNEGLSRATGEWIAWADADDEVEPEWASGIEEGVRAVGSCRGVVSFDARAVWDGEPRTGYGIAYGRPAGAVDPAVFAHDVIGACRTAGWLWCRAFARGLFDGRDFAGGSFEDYRMMCEILPDAEKVWHLARPLYVYRRTGGGLSQHVDRDAAREALAALMDMARTRSDRFARSMRKGVAVQMADFCRRAGGEPAFRAFIRRNLPSVLAAPDAGLRTKMKCLLEAF